MLSRKKPQTKPKAQPRAGRNLSQYGLFDIPDLNNVGEIDNMDEDDEDLEAELLALTGESNVPRKPKPKVQMVLPAADLDLMVAASLKDIPSDESVSGDDDDLDLLDELNAITGDEEGSRLPAAPIATPVVPSSGSQMALLHQRLAIYQEAEVNAQAAGETARARRFSRGIKTLKDLLKQASNGQVINEEDIPPEVSVKKTEPKPVQTVSDELSEEPAAPIRVAPPPPIPPRGAGLGIALPGLTGQVQPQSQVSADRKSPATPLLPSSPRTLATADCQSPEAPHEQSPGSSSGTTLLPSSPRTLSTADCQAPNPEDSTPVTVDKDMLQLLIARREEYKRSALIAKKGGDMSTAINHIKIVKQFDSVIAGLESGQPVDLSAMPPPPPAQTVPERDNVNSEMQQSAEPATPVVALPEEGVEETQEFTVDMPSSILEALEQRLAKYKSQEEAAKTEGNSSKARRMGRIVKQYVDAIKLHKAGKPIPLDELPTPPGYPPIPIEGGGVKPPPSPQPTVKQAAPPSPAPVSTPAQPEPQSPQPSTSSDTSPDKLNVRKIGGSRQDKQLHQLLEKQKQFKLAALQAKQKGEVAQAKEYLRLAKGFDKLIEASNCGLPVDMNTVPVPPSSKLALETDFDIVSADDCTPAPLGGSDILEKLERDLIEQMKKSVETRNHFKAIGDIASANRFEQQALHSKKDLDLVRVAHKHNHPVPRFHYETRSFSIVQCNTDLGDNDLELTIAQGINYNVPNPKEVDTYVRFEFPWPTEEPYRDKTATVYNTNNPVYDEKFTLPIQRNVRACQRVFKRHAIKCEVWSKGEAKVNVRENPSGLWPFYNIVWMLAERHTHCDKASRIIVVLQCSLWFCSEGCCTSVRSCFSSFRGFFRGDSLIGTAVVKLQPLENKCILHESFDLMDGRKAVGGKLEVKVRLRNPIQTKQVERVEEKWLVIDH